jgi:hypothetical protein
MDETFCKVCGQKFLKSDLLEGSCSVCLEVAKKPKASGPVLTANDLNYSGKSKSPWLWIVCIVILAVFVKFYWPQKHSVDLSGSQEIGLNDLLTDLSENKEENEAFMRSVLAQSHADVLKNLLLISLNVKNAEILKTLTNKEKKY